MPQVTCQYAPCAKTFSVIPSVLASGKGRYCSVACYHANITQEKWRNPAWVRAYNLAYRAKHADRLRTQQEYKRAHLAERLAYNKAWRAAHPDRVTSYASTSAAWDAAHPERRRDTTQRYRARKQNAPLVETIDRQAIYARDRWVCQLCLKPVSQRLRHPHPGSASLDHVIPMSQGGNHSAQNLVLAHLGCNNGKSNRRTRPQQQRLFG